MDMKPKLRDILADAIGREPDMQLVSTLPAPSSPASDLGPDVLLCESDDPTEATMPTNLLLHELPHARVLVIASSGDRAAVYELRPHRRELADVSISDVIQAVRHGVGPNLT